MGTQATEGSGTIPLLWSADTVYCYCYCVFSDEQFMGENRVLHIPGWAVHGWVWVSMVICLIQGKVFHDFCHRFGNFNMVKKIKDRWIIDTQFVSSEKISSQFACNTTAHLLNYAEIVFYLNQSWIKNTPAFVISAGIFLFKWGHRVLLHYICIIFMDMS